MDFEIIIQEGSLGDPQPKLHKLFAPRAKNRKTFKQLLFNQWLDFEIIIHACSLDDPQPKVLKQFHSVEQKGGQGYK